jgi:hypothetical protein
MEQLARDVGGSIAPYMPSGAPQAGDQMTTIVRQFEDRLPKRIAEADRVPLSHEDFAKHLRNIEEAITTPRPWAEVRKRQREAIEALKANGSSNSETARAIHKYDPQWFAKASPHTTTIAKDMEILFKSMTGSGKKSRKAKASIANQKKLLEMRLEGEAELKKMHLWTPEVKAKMDNMVLPFHRTFIDSEAFKEKAEGQHPWKYRRPKNAGENYTDAQKKWIDKFKEQMEHGTWKHKDGSMRTTTNIRAKAKKHLKRHQYKEIKEDLDELYRDMQRKNGIITLQHPSQLEKKNEEVIPYEHDSDDDYQPPPETAPFELDDDLEPIPVGTRQFGPQNREPEENPWHERVFEKYKPHPDDWSDSSDSGFDEIDYSDDDNPFPQGDDKWEKLRERLGQYNAAETREDTAEEPAETKKEETGGMWDTTKKIIRGVGGFIGGPVLKTVMTGLDILDSVKVLAEEDRIRTPSIARGTIFEPAFKVGQLLHEHNPQPQSGYNQYQRPQSHTDYERHIKAKYRNHYNYLLRRYKQGKAPIRRFHHWRY